MIPVPKVAPPPVPKRASARSWEGGYNSRNDAIRTPGDSLIAATNVLLYQNGTIGPRASLVPYGQRPLGTIMGSWREYLHPITREKWMISLQNVAGLTQVTVSKDGGAWTIKTGKTYNNTARANFFQIDDKVMIMNGEDNLSFYDIVADKVVPLIALSTPATPTAVQTNMSGSTYSYYYAITAISSYGQTAGSAYVKQPVAVQRGAWGNDKNIKLSWGAVTNARGYNVFMGETPDHLYLVATNITGTTWTDDGTPSKDVTNELPIGDTTAGPRVTDGIEINGQAFFWGDKENPRYVRYGGKGTSILDLSPYGGGGWVELGRGTKNFPSTVKPLRTGQGDPVPLVLMQGTNGNGKRIALIPSQVSVGDEIIPYFDPKEDNGKDGTDSPYGVVIKNDSIYYPSKKGFKTTGTKPQLQNLLSTDTISQTIDRDIAGLNVQAMKNCVGIDVPDGILWALPVGSSTNNEIWKLDLDRKGAWMRPLRISADWMEYYEDNAGVSRLLIMSGNMLYEFNDKVKTRDAFGIFSTYIASGQNRFSDDGKDWAHIIDVTFTIIRPVGQITVNVNGFTEAQIQTGGIANVATKTKTYAAVEVVAGWGEYAWSQASWGKTEAVPKTTGAPSDDIIVTVERLMKTWGWDLSSIISGTDYQLSDVIVQYIPVGVI